MLLDTHVVLWWQENSSDLADEIRAVIHAADEVYVSAASAWEAEIKRSLGKLRFPHSFVDVLEPNGFRELPVTMRYAAATATLGMHHRDPFDRILVTQALVEDCILVTADRRLARYGVKVMYAGR
ncbi:MAG TPA: type II toxin-antitoxin system VapC family toxin [Candidatus Elarobacter sp.]|nr:type II toxin-antitoxin system VapC family toxin [Candidatus Elarobacter sp.]